jgi:hypothetical protein
MDVYIYDMIAIKKTLLVPSQYHQAMLLLVLYVYLFTFSLLID